MNVFREIRSCCIFELRVGFYRKGIVRKKNLGKI